MRNSRNIKCFGGTFVHQMRVAIILQATESHSFMSIELYHNNRYDELCGHSNPDFWVSNIRYNVDTTSLGEA